MPLEMRQRFLVDLSQEVNEAAGQEIPLPDELSRFLELTDHADGGILRDFMPVGLHGLFLLGICPREWMSDRLPCRDADWEAMTGWQSALGEGSTQILYSRKPNGNADEARWKRRVYNIGSKDQDEHWFENIADFLDFMAGWFDRLPDGWEDERKEPMEYDSEPEVNSEMCSE